MESLISVLHFTSKILIPKYPHTLLPLLSSLYVIHQQNNKRNKLKLRMFFVPDDLFLKLFPSDLKGLLLGDITSCILISFNTAKALSIPDFSWLILKKFNVGNNDLNTILDIDPLNARDSYLLQAVAVPDMDDFVLVASDTTCHNIKQTLFTLNEQKSDVALDEVSVLTTSYVDKIGFAPYMARHVTLSLLESPLDISDQVIDAALGTYFDNPHFLHSGDVFSIDILKYAPEIYYTIGNQNIKMLYFKVAKIKGESYNNILLENVKSGYYVLKNYTNISQRLNVQSYMPCSSGYCLEGIESVTGKNYPLYFLSYCPSGLDQYFRELVDSVNPFIQNISELKLQVCPIFLIHGPRGVGKQEVVKSAAKVLGLHIWNVDCLELQSTSSGQTEGKLNLIFTKVHKFSPCILLLRNIEALCKDKDGHEDSRVISSFQGYLSKMFEKKEKFPVLIVATSNTKNEASPVIAPALARIFLHVIRIEAPSEGERAAMFDWIIKGSNVKLGADVSLDKLASRSSGFLFADLQTVVSQALRCYHQRLKAFKGDAEDTLNVVLDMSDFEEALEVMSSAYSDAIGAPKIPAVTWSDVGGLTDLKSEIMRTIMLPIRHPEMVASGLRRSGILLFGPPGTGKTLLAKAVATECNLNFLSVKGPELLNMYVGQSEANVREVFARARAASPCIIFFDELDSLAPNRGRSGDSAGVMDRVVSQLLAEMDGLQKSTHLFVIGATNRPDLIDPALLRPGRFDKLLYVGVCGDKNTQLAVLAALTRKFHFRDGVSLEDFVASLPSNLTGADLYSVCANAWLNAVRTKIQQGAAEGSNETVEVGPEHFQAAVENLVASVSEKDLAYFRKLHQELGVPLPSTL